MDANPEITNTAQAALYAKMARVMSKMSRIEKRGHNDHFNYDYATSEDVADAVRQGLAEENIAFFPSILSVEQSDKHTRARFQFVFADGETGAVHLSQWEGEAQDSLDKGISKAATSAVKYFLLKTFLIATGDEPDPDSDAGTGRQSKPKAKAQSGNGAQARLIPEELRPADGKDYTTFYHKVAPAYGLDKNQAADILRTQENDAVKAFEVIARRFDKK